MEEFNGGYGRGETEKDGDFEEEDVWGYVKERDSSSSSSRVTIPRGKSSSSSTSNKSMLQKLSGPVNIPEWSKNTNKKKSRRVSNSITHHGSSPSSSVAYTDNNGGEVEEDGDGIMVPPHEYIARRVARNKIASFSMMEGVGRTLKGRDLSKLRNAILTKTGFLE
ncbi:hypothetical protein CQW23_30104 [Capsicum baccatum]|uniref:Senescence regulator S40 n=1 Tax=Capsicum baccatum TaxID=33114 RepID=A0A2G2VBG1_CAPBA|nr:hypothetical protein CQW23_30104 [Capsicum baccatum]